MPPLLTNREFRARSPDDAHPLSRHFAPELTEHDLSHLGAYQAAVKLVVDGQDQPAFTLRTRQAQSPPSFAADHAE